MKITVTGTPAQQYTFTLVHPRAHEPLLPDANRVTITSHLQRLRELHREFLRAAGHVAQLKARQA